MWLFTRGYIPIYHHNITMKIIIITIFININGDLWRHTNTPRVKHGNAEMPHPAAPGGDRNTPRRSPHLAARTRTVRNPGGVRVFSNDFLGGNDGKRMGKWWENYGKRMGKWWENDGKMMRKPSTWAWVCPRMGGFTRQYVGIFMGKAVIDSWGFGVWSC